MIQNYFILAADERTAAMAFNTPDVAIDPRAVDAPEPGAAVNMNASAAGYAVGDSINLSGAYLAPKHIVDDPDYLRYAPAMVTYLADKPFGMIDDETVFLPSPPVP